MKKTERKIQTDDIEINNHFTACTRKFLDPKWEPKSRQDIVNLLLECQIGYISCGKAYDILLSKGVLNVPW